MDTLSHYREIIQKLLSDYASYHQADDEVRAEVIGDTSKDHYEMILVGWEGSQRVHNLAIHIDIIDHKVWLQHDGANLVVAEDLVKAGIPRENIVLGFRPPHLRQYTDFAVA